MTTHKERSHLAEAEINLQAALSNIAAARLEPTLDPTFAPVIAIPMMVERCHDTANTLNTSIGWYAQAHEWRQAKTAEDKIPE